MRVCVCVCVCVWVCVSVCVCMHVEHGGLEMIQQLAFCSKPLGVAGSAEKSRRSYVLVYIPFDVVTTSSLSRPPLTIFFPPKRWI